MADTKTSLKVEGPRARKLREMVAAHRAVSKKSGTIDMKSAVQAAITCVEGFFPEAKDILLEEVELRQGHYENSPSEGRTYKHDPLWRVVVSFKSGKPGKLSEVMGGDPRLYREIYINPGDGLLRSMRTWGR
jgi:hypothetical protein